MNNKDNNPNQIFKNKINIKMKVPSRKLKVKRKRKINQYKKIKLN
jgi:hypothetical protein